MLSAITLHRVTPCHLFETGLHVTNTCLKKGMDVMDMGSSTNNNMRGHDPMTGVMTGVIYAQLGESCCSARY